MINQILPGAYVETIAGARDNSLGVSGVAAMPLALDWGATVTELEKGRNPLTLFGYPMNSVKMKLIREAMNYADKLIVYRLNSGNQASATVVSGLTATALCGGIRGNDISITVEEADESFIVKTWLDTDVMDTQIVSAAGDLKGNRFVTFSGTGTLETVTAKLSGGTNTAVEGAFAAFLAEMEKREFNVIAYTGTTESEKTALIEWLNRVREEDKMVQAVMNGSGFDNIAVVNNTVGGITPDYTLTAPEACATMAGILAKQGIEGSATYFTVEGWSDVNPRLTKVEMETRTQNGEILFALKYGKPTVLYDINSRTTVNDKTPEDWKKGLVIRTLDRYKMDLQKLLDTQAVGKIRNGVDGRNRIKGMICKMTTEDYQENGYIEGFVPDDVTVSEGDTRDSVVATVGIRVLDTADKIYITVTSL